MNESLYNRFLNKKAESLLAGVTKHIDNYPDKNSQAFLNWIDNINEQSVRY